MSTFSPTEAALEGFRIARERPRALAIWAGANLVISLVMALMLVSLFGPALAELETMAAGGSDDPAQTFAVIQKLLPFYALMLPVGLAVIAVFSAAVYRVVLRPADSAYGYLRLGRDELRLAVLMLIYFVLAMAFTFAVTLVAGLLAAAADTAGGGIAALLGLVILLGALGFMVFVAVRLSLAAPMTFTQQRLCVFESWALTRGSFWRLLGAYVLAVALIVIVVLLGMIIFAAVAAILVGGDLGQVGRVFSPDMSSLGAYFTPAMIVYLVFAAALSAVQNAVMYGVPAVAYRELSATAKG